MAVEDLADAGGADGVARADEATARVDRGLSPEGDVTGFDCFPALTGSGEAEVVDRHVFGGCEAVVGFDRVDPAGVRYPCALLCVGHRAADVRQDVLRVAALCDLILEAHARRRVPPALDAGDRLEWHANAVGPLLGVLGRGQKQGCGAVGHLRTVRNVDAAAYAAVELVTAHRVVIVHVPGTRLCVRVELRVCVVDRADLREVLVLEAVALVVLVAELTEELRERELDALGLELVPGGRAEEVAALARAYRLHLLDADHACEVVALGFDFSRSRE